VLRIVFMIHESWLVARSVVGLSRRMRLATTTLLHRPPAPMAPLGIVAALCRSNRVIGINRQLPWNVPDDRRDFVRLTRGKILILGRHTWQERGGGDHEEGDHEEEEEDSYSHVRHAQTTIVVSRTLTLTLNPPQLVVRPHFAVARSLPEALALARQQVEADATNSAWVPFENRQREEVIPNEHIPCWIAGGETIYQETILHPSVERLVLTKVDVQIDIDHPSVREIARFPCPSLWLHQYEEVSRIDKVDSSSGISYSVVQYNRRRRRSK